MHPIRHSALVTMRLEACGRTLSVSHLGPGRLIVRGSVSMPECSAMLRIMIDDHHESCEIHLPSGIDPARKWTVFDVKG